MRVLIADKFSQQGIQALRDLGVEVECQPQLTADELPQTLADIEADVLIVRSTKVTEAAFVQGQRLALVVRAGAGVNTIDLEAASRRGVFVANCPGKNAVAVAELVFGLLLAVDRHICDADKDLHQGQWNKKQYGQADGLHGRRMGLIGFGNIAKEVARRALGFGMDVVAYARSLDQDHAALHGVERAASLEELLTSCDVVSVHVPYAPATHHLIGAGELATMKQGAILLHTARGGIVDDAALAEAVARGHVRAAVDVQENEPGAGRASFDSQLAKTEGVVCTPHIGASTRQAEQAIADETVRIVSTFLRTGEVLNAVNVVRNRDARWTMVVRHLDRVGVLAQVLTTLREHDFNVQEMHNVIFHGDHAASATLTLELQPGEQIVDQLRRHPDILAVEVRAVS